MKLKALGILAGCGLLFGAGAYAAPKKAAKGRAVGKHRRKMMMALKRQRRRGLYRRNKGKKLARGVRFKPGKQLGKSVRFKPGKFLGRRGARFKPGKFLGRYGVRFKPGKGLKVGKKETRTTCPPGQLTVRVRCVRAPCPVQCLPRGKVSKPTAPTAPTAPTVLEPVKTCPAGTRLQQVTCITAPCPAQCVKVSGPTSLNLRPLLDKRSKVLNAASAIMKKHHETQQAVIQKIAR